MDLLDDLERALIDAGVIAFDSSQNKYVRTPDDVALTRAVEQLHLNAGYDQREWLISAPGKVILFGEHAVVHGVVSSSLSQSQEQGWDGFTATFAAPRSRSPAYCLQMIKHLPPFVQTAIAASVDLRCYGLASPRTDGKLSVHLWDMDDFYQEWDIDSLPWDAVTSVSPGNNHPEELDQRLIEALNERALGSIPSEKKTVHVASLTFLYLYMTLSHRDRYVLRGFSQS